MSFAVRESKELDMTLGDGTTTTMRDLAEELPHGSGVDCSWDVWVKSPREIHFHNSYHAMNENGMYCGYHDFKVVLFQHRADRYHNLSGTKAGHVQVTHKEGDWDFRITGLNGRMADVKDSLYESVGFAWEKFGIGKLRQEIVPCD